MLDDERKSLSAYRVEKAEECIKASKLLYSEKCMEDAVNRAYYAIFHAARAVMACDGADRAKHSGVIAYFQQHYVKTGIFDKEYSTVIQNAFEMRQESDYEDFYVISKEDVKIQIENAEKFTQAVREYLNTRY